MLNTPMTYPPAPLERGFVVSGLETPPGAAYTHPAGLQDELERRVGYRIELDRWYRRGHEQDEMDAILDLSDTHRRAALHLLETRDCDLYFVTLRAADHAQHYFWRFWDAGHPAFTLADHERFGDFIPQSYAVCDAAIADMMAACGPDTNVLVVSDHGFGRETKMVHLSNWLEQEGFLRFKTGPAGRIKRTAFRAGFTADNVMNLLGKLRLERLYTSVSRTAKAGIFNRLFLSYGDIDWTRTVAYARGQIGQIFLNVRGREPHGIVEPGEAYARTRQHIIDALMRLRDPETGETVVDRVHVREDLYDGAEAGAAPDLVIDWRDMEYWAFDVITGGRKIIGPNLATRSGGHRQNGILLAHGPAIAEAREIAGARIIDVAPTALQLLGLPAPVQMDGRVLADIFRTTPAIAAREETAASSGEEAIYSEEGEEAVRERLRQLGYL
jgi:predicted AlkP superfamily phosphohydrolase/phosphomutase